MSKGAGDVSSMSICRDHNNDTSYQIIDQLWASELSNHPPVPPEITIENVDSMSADNDLNEDQEDCNSEVNNESNTTLTGKSIAHKHFNAGEAVFLSFDVETGGDHCGIVQLLCQIFRIIPGTSSSDPPKIVTTKDDIYNKYVKPPEGAIWSQHAINIHGITPSDNRVQSAETIETAWIDFCTFVDSHIGSNEVGILLAYNSKTCDLKWLWKLINIPNSSMFMPSKCKFFLNPLKVLKHYKSCPLHPTKTKLESSNLQSVYKYVTRTDLIGAHDSIIDCKAQTAIVGSRMFYSFVDKTKSIFFINDMFLKREQSKMKKTTRTCPASP